MGWDGHLKMASHRIAHCASQTHYLLKVFMWDGAAHLRWPALGWPTVWYKHIIYWRCSCGTGCMACVEWRAWFLNVWMTYPTFHSINHTCMVLVNAPGGYQRVMVPSLPRMTMGCWYTLSWPPSSTGLSPDGCFLCNSSSQSSFNLFSLGVNSEERAWTSHSVVTWKYNETDILIKCYLVYLALHMPALTCLPVYGLSSYRALGDRSVSLVLDFLDWAMPGNGTKHTYNRRSFWKACSLWVLINYP